jgi:hypothetical protein
MTTTINITWHQPDERSQGREDSTWYSYSPDHHDIVASVSNGERTVHIYSDGRTRVHIPYEAGDWSKGHHVLRYSDEWSAHNINNDKDIYEATENGLLDWINNSWFDIYADDHLDCVQHSLTDAIASAHELLANDEYWETEG